MPSQYGSVRDVWSARLYHYQTFDPAHLESVLRDRKVYCADPNNLNDPWDCKPWFGPQLIGRTCRRVLKTIASRTGATPDLLSDTRSALNPHVVPLRKEPYRIGLEFHSAITCFSRPCRSATKSNIRNFTSTHVRARHAGGPDEGDCWRSEDEFRLIASPDLAIDNPLRPLF